MCKDKDIFMLTHHPLDFLSIYKERKEREKERENERERERMREREREREREKCKRDNYSAVQSKTKKQLIFCPYLGTFDMMNQHSGPNFFQ